MDIGRSVNPGIDIGQVISSFNRYTLSKRNTKWFSAIRWSFARDDQTTVPN